MDAGLYRAARDHLQQADAILSRADSDAISVRTVIRYVVLILNEKSEADGRGGTVVPFAGVRRARLDD